MNDIGSLGIILLLALAAGHIVKWLRVPEVTGYLLAGVVLGPSVLGWVTPDNVSALRAFSEVALGLILFSLGTVFESVYFRRAGRRLVTITLVESSLVATVVGVGMFAVGQPWPIALVLGVMSMETAAASTLMVLRECNARGPLTETLTGVFALDNLACLLAFNVAVAAIQFAAMSEPASLWGVARSVGPVFWQLLGAAALGYVAGFLLAAWSSHVTEHGERLILLAGCILLCVGASNMLHVSAMVTNLAVGATVANLSTRSRAFVESLGHTDPPLYAIFFVLAGAELNLSLLASLGVVGAVYVGGRLLGKAAGAAVGARIAGADPAVRSGLPTAMLAQAGLAIGLTLSMERRLPQYASQITTVILAAVIIFELIGPLGVRWSVARRGEAQPEEPAGDVPIW